MPNRSDGAHVAASSSDGVTSRLVNTRPGNAVSNKSFVDSFLTPADASMPMNYSRGDSRIVDRTMRGNPRPAPRRSPAPGIVHSAPSRDMQLHDLQPLDREDDLEVEMKNSSPVAVAIAVSDDHDARFTRDTPPLVVVRHQTGGLHVPQHIPRPPVRLPPTSYRSQQTPPPRQGQDG